MDPAAAAAVLLRTLPQPLPLLTVADASVRSGLALRDAEAGLTWLASEYRGQYRVTEAGDLVHVFPHGFTKPWETKETVGRWVARAGSVLAAAGRLVVRAWLLIAIVGYALAFVAIGIALSSARGSDRDDGPGSSIFAGLLRLVAEAAWWTFHPFSPLAYYRHDPYAVPSPRAQRRMRAAAEAEEVPHYEKVNRFVWGPPAPAIDPHAERARVLAEVRALRGRISLADVMRVTGLPRAEADPLMARLMLDHDGTVEVSEGGGIFYRFEALRKTASTDGAAAERPAPAWQRPTVLRPLTGNTFGANLGVAALNGFNLLAGLWAIANDVTLANLARMLDRTQPYVPVPGGVPLVLGVIPVVFSAALFALPAARALWRRREQRALDDEKARLGVLREVVTHAAKGEAVDDAALRTAVRVATGREPTSREVSVRVAEFGGDAVVSEAGEVRYRFAEMEADAAAAAGDREAATEDEAGIGKVVFASDR